jgi:hypothetical protein
MKFEKLDSLSFPRNALVVIQKSQEARYFGRDSSQAILPDTLFSMFSVVKKQIVGPYPSLFKPVL